MTWQPGEILQVFRGEARGFGRGIWGRGGSVLALPLEGLERQLPELDVGVGLADPKSGMYLLTTMPHNARNRCGLFTSFYIFNAEKYYSTLTATGDML